MHLLRIETRSIDGTAEAVDLAQSPAEIVALLAARGVIVHARPEGAAGARLVRLTHGEAGVQENEICACRLGPLIPGLSHGL